MRGEPRLRAQQALEVAGTPVELPRERLRSKPGLGAPRSDAERPRGHRRLAPRSGLQEIRAATAAGAKAGPPGFVAGAEEAHVFRPRSARTAARPAVDAGRAHADEEA